MSDNSVEVQVVGDMVSIEQVQAFADEVLVFAEASEKAVGAVKTAWQSQLRMAQMWMGMDIQLESLKALEVTDPREGKKGDITVGKLYLEAHGSEMDKGNMSKAVNSLRELAPTGNEKAQERVIEVGAISGREPMINSARALKVAKKNDLPDTPTPSKVLTALKNDKDPQIPVPDPVEPSVDATKPVKHVFLVRSEDAARFEREFDGSDDDIAVAVQLLADLDLFNTWKSLITKAMDTGVTPEQLMEDVGQYEPSEDDNVISDEIPATLDEAIEQSNEAEDDDGGF